MIAFLMRINLYKTLIAAAKEILNETFYLDDAMGRTLGILNILGNGGQGFPKMEGVWQWVSPS